MKFGIILPVAIDDSAGPDYRETLRVGQLAEQLGYDFATVSHHRFDTMYPSAPFALLSALAVRTSRIHLGTNIIVLPAMHPVEVAEQIATVDRLSNGRVFVGAGIGYLRREYDAAGIRFEARGERMTEALEVLRLLLTEEKATFAGEHFQFEDIALQPRPVQRPNPPILVGAQSKRAVRRAARLGDGWTTDSKTTLSDLAPLVAMYRAEIAATGDDRPRTISLTRDVGIGPSREAVKESWMPSVMKIFADYWRMGMRFPDPARVSERLADGDLVGFEEFVADRFVAGSPEDCIAALQQFIGTVGCDQILIRLGYGSQFDERALRLFAAEVIPAFRD